MRPQSGLHICFLFLSMTVLIACVVLSRCRHIGCVVTACIRKRLFIADYSPSTSPATSIVVLCGCLQVRYINTAAKTIGLKTIDISVGLHRIALTTAKKSMCSWPHFAAWQCVPNRLILHFRCYFQHSSAATYRGSATPLRLCVSHMHNVRVILLVNGAKFPLAYHLMCLFASNSKQEKPTNCGTKAVDVPGNFLAGQL